MLYSHDCENRIVHRERPNQPISCDKCYAIWLHNKSFKRILKKMDRYNLVEDILRKSWRFVTVNRLHPHLLMNGGMIIL